jgi:hypothetical protein
MSTTVQAGHATLRFGMEVEDDDESPEAEAIYEHGGWFGELLAEDGPGLEDMLNETVRRFVTASGYDGDDRRLYISVDVYD